MKPESAFYMRAARHHLAKAERLLAHGFADEAARAAYMAALNAARGLIFERTNTVSKTHGGTHSRFAELTRDDPLETTTRKFLGKAYELKTEADYGLDVSFGVDPDTARGAIDAAGKMLAAIDMMMAPTNPEEPQ